MPLIPSVVEFGRCPYCSPYRIEPLKFDKFSNTIYCVSCLKVVKIIDMD